MMDHPEIAIVFPLFIGVAAQKFLTKVPYTATILSVGIGLGCLDYGVGHILGSFGHMWSNINPNLLLYCFLPILLFEGSFLMETQQIKKCLIHIIILATIGVLLQTLFLGLVHHFVFPYKWSWSICFLLGGLLSATDPVAVLSVLKELGIVKKLTTIIEGESMMNDGVAMVVFEVFRQMATGKHVSTTHILSFVCKASLGAVGLGLAFGIILVCFLVYTHQNTLVQFVLTFTTSFGLFFLAQYLAQVSGILSVTTMGMVVAVFSKSVFTGINRQTIHHFWCGAGYMANTLVFLLSGVIIAENVLRNHSHIKGCDWGYLFVLYLFLQVTRVMIIIILFPALSSFGYGLNIKEGVILSFAGLRGPVALALALLIQHETGISSRTQAQFVFFTGGTVVLTILINGGASQFLLRLLNIQNEETAILEGIKRAEEKRRMISTLKELQDDEDELLHGDYRVIKDKLNLLLEDDKEELANVQAIRIHFLKVLLKVYEEMLDENRTTWLSATVLMMSVDEAIDKVYKEEIIEDWTCIYPYPRRFIKYFITEACCITTTFIRAHTLAESQLQEYMGDVENVIDESRAEVTKAYEFLHEIRGISSEKLLAVNTQYALNTILINNTNNMV